MFTAYNIDIVLTHRPEDEFTVEIDTVMIRGKPVKIYSISAYLPEHLQMHKKFLSSYYAGDADIAVFFAKNLELKGPPEMRNYYRVMIDRIESNQVVDKE